MRVIVVYNKEKVGEAQTAAAVVQMEDEEIYQMWKRYWEAYGYRWEVILDTKEN